jgi:DNA-binding IclR family transcriptional regulator
MAKDRKPKKRPARRSGAAARSAAGNRSVLVAVHILKSLATLGAPAVLGDIARQAVMSKSRAYRYLAGLLQTGLVEQDSASGRYALGPTTVELGLIALGQTDAIKLGNETLVQLTEETGLVSLLSVWGSYGPTILKWEHGRLLTAVRIREGRTLPLLTTATGRVFMTFLAREDWEPIIARELETRNATLPAARAMTMENVEALRGEVLRNSVGRMVGEENPGLAALSAAVFDRSGKIAMTLTIISIVGTFDTNYQGSPARVLRATANQLSRRLGAPLPQVRKDQPRPPLIAVG